MLSTHTSSSTRVVLITGAAGGIGRGLALAFGRRDYVLALNDVVEQPLNALSDRLASEGVSANCYVVDISDPDATARMVQDIESDIGPITVLVNNAAVFSSVSLLDMSDDEWDRVQAVNVKGALHCAASVVPFMKNRGGGAIINMASLAGKRSRTIFGQLGESTWAAYAVSKSSVASLTFAMAYEWAPLGIRVNAVAPGPILTGYKDDEKNRKAAEVPVHRIGTPEDVANAVTFLASEEASFIQGEILDVNGGLLMD